MDFHIGSFIKKIAEERKIGPTELGRMIDTSKQNVYGIFKRRSIDTRLLMKLSHALDYNFFLEYVRLLNPKGEPWNNLRNHSHTDDDMHLRMESLRAENSSLQENNRLLKEMVALLKERNPSPGF